MTRLNVLNFKDAIGNGALMKRSLSWGKLLLSLALLLSGCAYYSRPNPQTDLAFETWQKQVDTNSKKWAVGADDWFLKGVIHSTDEMDRFAPPDVAMSVMKVKISNAITDLRISGDFKVQIFGTNNCNSLYVYGPNDSVRGVILKAHGNTVCLNQAENMRACDMRCVIIRIGVRNLSNLYQMGSGTIVGRMVRSNCLCINSSGSGNIYLGGPMRLTRVISTGKGGISVFGAKSPQLAILTAGSGSLNICGNVGIHDIIHHGTGNINILGANTDSLKLYADGCGVIGIRGCADIKCIDARDRAQVYAGNVNGLNLNVNATDSARVGLAGCMKNLTVNASKCARVEAKYLFTNDAYVRASGGAHVNVTGANKVFASSLQNSSVYYYGAPTTFSQFNRQNGVVLLMTACNPRPGGGYCPFYPPCYPVRPECCERVGCG